MAEREALTAAYVRSILDYNPETGVLIWKERTPEMFTPTAKRGVEHICANWNSKYAGRVAGGAGTWGYWYVRIDGSLYGSHRIAWLIMTGEWPVDEIDHRDVDPSNNRFDNLREATRSQNQANQPVLARNTSGEKGVTFHKGASKWMAQIGINGEHKYLGIFDKKVDAAAAYAKAAIELHGAFARIE